MKFSAAIDLYVADQKSYGRINSRHTETRYRSTLNCHCDDVTNRAPHTTGREEVKQTLRRWPNPNTQRVARAILVSFYDWTVEEGIRPNNPARQTRRPKRKPAEVYRLTRAETIAMLAAAHTDLERRTIYLGICAGLRNAELRGLQGRHLRRPGFIWVSKEIAKGGRERWIPVIADLAPILTQLEHLADDEYVLPAQRWRDPGTNRQHMSLTRRPMSPQAVYYLVRRVGTRAGIAAGVHPHLLRHAYGDHIAKRAGLLVAQHMLGHASVETTRSTYVGKTTLDELTEAVAGFTFAYPPTEHPEKAQEATMRLELMLSPYRLVERFFPEIGRAHV